MSAITGGITWTRALELRLVALVRQREVLWRPGDNTNHSIALKHRAYAELARLLCPQATARAVRDRWVNIRSTYNHNVRKLTARPDYQPSWPLWNACQFLGGRADPADSTEQEMETMDSSSLIDPAVVHAHRRRAPRSPSPASRAACRAVLRRLARAAHALTAPSPQEHYGHLARHVVHRLSTMRPQDGHAAAALITDLLCGSQL